MEDHHALGNGEDGLHDTGSPLDHDPLAAGLDDWHDHSAGHLRVEDPPEHDPGHDPWIDPGAGSGHEPWHHEEHLPADPHPAPDHDGHHDQGLHAAPEDGHGHHTHLEPVKAPHDHPVPEPPDPGGYLHEIHRAHFAGPAEDQEHWQPQTGPNDCALAAEKGVLESLLGREIPEHDLRNVAIENGWLDPEKGTNPEDVGKLLELYGVPVERSHGCSLTGLYEALQRNEKVLVGLDANEIWHPVSGPGGAPLELPDQPHLVWVTNLDFDDAGHVHVVLNDSASPDGKGLTVDASDFLNAWADFNNFTLITRLH